MWRVAVWEALWVIDDGADLSSTASWTRCSRVKPTSSTPVNKTPDAQISLEKIDEEKGMRTIQTPGSIPLLLDLVKPKEPQFNHAFYKVLRDTLIV